MSMVNTSTKPKQTRRNSPWRLLQYRFGTLKVAPTAGTEKPHAPWFLVTTAAIAATTVDTAVTTVDTAVITAAIVVTQLATADTRAVTVDTQVAITDIQVAITGIIELRHRSLRLSIDGKISVEV